MNAPTTHDPLVVNTKDGAVWWRRAVTEDGRGLYAADGSCACPEFLLVPLSELATHGIVGSAHVLPVPVGPVPQELPAERLTEIAARTQAATAGPWCTDRLAESDDSESIGVDAGDDNWIVPCQDLDPADAEFIAHARADVPALLDEIDRLTAQRDRRRIHLVALQNDALNVRGALSPNGEARKVPFPLGPTLLPAVEWLIGRVAELEADLAAKAQDAEAAVNGWGRARDRIAELESLLAEDGCSCPPAVHAHQVGCPLDLPAPGSPERPVNELTAVYMPAAAYREDPHDSPLHHDYKGPSRDFPELGGAS